MTGLGLLRRLARRFAIVRALGGHPLIGRAIRLKRVATVLHPGPAFLVGELRGGTRRYSVARGSAVLLRHRSRDVDIAYEIFGEQTYEPPHDLAGELGGSLRVFDLGGNVGMFGAFALKRWNVGEVTSFEPDPENAAMLEAAITLNHAEARWRLRQVAVSDASGTMVFVPGDLAESRRAEESETGLEVPMVDLFSLDHHVDLLKMDIEGGEWAILTDARMSDLGARIIVMEWHWRFAPQEDAHGAALALLKRAGYVIRGDRVHPSRDIGLMWASRP